MIVGAHMNREIFEGGKLIGGLGQGIIRRLPGQCAVIWQIQGR